MRSSIERLKSGIDRSSSLISRVRNAGMEVSAEELALADARSHLTLARTEVHTFEPGRLAPIVEEGLQTVGRVEAAGNRAAAELRYRRRGLAWSLGAILFFILALALKIRQIERRPANHP
jgi:hypothetical protein